MTAHKSVSKASLINPVPLEVINQPVIKTVARPWFHMPVRLAIVSSTIPPSHTFSYRKYRPGSLRSNHQPVNSATDSRHPHTRTPRTRWSNWNSEPDPSASSSNIGVNNRMRRQDKQELVQRYRNSLLFHITNKKLNFQE